MKMLTYRLSNDLLSSNAHVKPKGVSDNLGDLLTFDASHDAS